jgi:hypothetical protein
MTIGTAGTNAATSLTALYVPGGYMQLSGVPVARTESAADIATINAAIMDDQNVNQPAPNYGPTWGWSRAGQLYVPNRGWLKTLPGDMICVDSTGWPILLSFTATSTGPWTHTTT